jgi:hypothetical protein
MPCGQGDVTGDGDRSKLLLDGAHRFAERNPDADDPRCVEPAA